MEQRRATRGRSTCRRRAPGSMPGTHTVGFDGPSETIELTHTVRDRAVFARGALTAAQWLVGTARLVFDARHDSPDVVGAEGAGAMRTPFTGVGTALVTPFTTRGALDEAGRHSGSPSGRSTPASTSSCRAARRARRRRSVAAERRASSSSCSKRPKGKVPVLAGAGGYDTREVDPRRRARCRSVGAHGILSVTPYYNKPTPEGLYQHFSAIAESTPLPIVLYNVPGRTGCNIEPATLARLATIPQRRRRQGSVRQHHADGRDLPRGARRTSSCCPATMR